MKAGDGTSKSTRQRHMTVKVRISRFKDCINSYFYYNNRKTAKTKTEHSFSRYWVSLNCYFLRRIAIIYKEIDI